MKSAYTANLLNSTNYEQLRAKADAIFRHTFNPDTTYYVGPNYVSISGSYGQPINEQEAIKSLSWFLDGIPYSTID